MITSANGSSVEERLRLELQDAREQLACESACRQKLERAIIDVVDQERRRMAKMLHDTACQSLNGIALLARVLLRRANREDSGMSGEIQELSESISAAVREIHWVIDELRLVADGGQDLRSILEQVVKLISQKVPCELECPEKLNMEDCFRAGQLVQIAHEAASNAARRTGVKRIDVRVSRQGETITVDVRDDAPVQGAEPDGIYEEGSEMMRLRARATGASINFSYQASEGTVVSCKFR